MLGRVPWDMVLEKRRVQQSCLIFKDYILQAQEQSTMMCRKSSKSSTMPTCMNNKLLTQLKLKREAQKHRISENRDRWPKEYRETIWTCRNGLRKAKAHMVRDVSGNKKGFFSYISSKMKTRKNVGPLLKEMGNLVTKDMKKAKVLKCLLHLRLYW